MSRTAHENNFLNADSVQEEAFMNKTQPLCVTGWTFLFAREGGGEEGKEGFVDSFAPAFNAATEPHSEPGAVWWWKGSN